MLEKRWTKTDWRDEAVPWAISLIIMVAIMTMVVVVPCCHSL